MKLPRVRFTIAGLMALTLLVGVGLWFEKQARKRRSPSMAEIAAHNRLLDVMLVRALTQVDMVGTEADQSPDQKDRLRAIRDKTAQLRSAVSAAQAAYDREQARRLSWW